MTEPSTRTRNPVALDHDRTLVVVIELSLKSWLAAASAPVSYSATRSAGTAADATRQLHHQQGRDRLERGAHVPGLREFGGEAGVPQAGEPPSRPRPRFHRRPADPLIDP